MNPFSILSAMNIGLADKFSLFLILIGIKDATRIDVHSDMDTPDMVRTALFRMELCFTGMETSGKHHHLCGLAVAKNRPVACEFKKAAEANDEKRIRRMSGYYTVFPIVASECMALVMQLKTKAPQLHQELIDAKQIAA